MMEGEKLTQPKKRAKRKEDASRLKIDGARAVTVFKAMQFRWLLALLQMSQGSVKLLFNMPNSISISHLNKSSCFCKDL